MGIDHLRRAAKGRAGVQSCPGRKGELPGDGQGQRWHCQGMAAAPGTVSCTGHSVALSGTRGHSPELDHLPVSTSLLTALIKPGRGPKPALETLV